MLGRKEKLVSFRNGLFRSKRKEVGLVIYCCVTNTTPKVNGVYLALKSMVWLGLGGTAHLCLALSQGPACMCLVVDGGCCYIFHWAGTGNLHAASPHGLDGIIACWLHSRENALREDHQKPPCLLWSGLGNHAASLLPRSVCRGVTTASPVTRRREIDTISCWTPQGSEEGRAPEILL